MYDKNYKVKYMQLNIENVAEIDPGICKIISFMKSCTTCGELKPNNRDYFHVESTPAGTLKKSCKDCENTKRTDEYANNPENRKYHITKAKKRKDLKDGLFKSFNNEDWEFALNYFGYKCAFCNRSLEEIEREAEIKEEEGHRAKKVLSKDHIIPVSKEGPYIATNIIPACNRCNSSKKASDIVAWYSKQPCYKEENLDQIIKYMVEISLLAYELLDEKVS